MWCGCVVQSLALASKMPLGWSFPRRKWMLKAGISPALRINDWTFRRQTGTKKAVEWGPIS